MSIRSMYIKIGAVFFFTISLHTAYAAYSINYVQSLTNANEKVFSFKQLDVELEKGCDIFDGKTMSELGFLSSDKNHTFIQIGAGNVCQGWKLHVSSQPKLTSMEKIFKTIYPILIQYEAFFKYATLGGLWSMGFQTLDGEFVQKGKFITIYPKSLTDANNIAVSIDIALSDAINIDLIDPVQDFETIVNDAQLGDTGGLSTRYGVFQGSKLFENVAPHAFISTLDVPDLKMKTTDDTRTYPWPEFVNRWIPKPFPELAMTWERNNKKVCIWDVKGSTWDDTMEWLQNDIEWIKK